MSSLKDLLGDLYTPEIEAKIGQSQIYIWNKEKPETEPFPKFRVNEMTESLKTKNADLEGQIKNRDDAITERDKQLKDLKKAAEGHEGLQKTIEELQKSNKDQKDAFEQEKTNLANKEVEYKKSFAVKENLLNAGVSDPDARETLALKIRTSVGLDKIEVGEDGKIKGFDDMLKPMKENKAFAGFFGQEVIAGQKHQHGDISDNEFFTREQVTGMSQEQVTANIEKINKSMAHWK